MADDTTITPEVPDMRPDATKKVAKKKATKLSDPKHAEVQQVVREALTAFLKNKGEQKRPNDMDAMVATCEEFLKSFVIFGYDFEGNPIAPVFCAHNQQEADALSMYITKFFNTNVRQM